MERAPRFVSFDADTETRDIHARVEALPAEHQVRSDRCTTVEMLAAALSAPASLLIVMTHGYRDTGEWISDHGTGQRKQVVRIDDVAPRKLDCDALVLLACYQRETPWSSMLREGAALAYSPDLVSTSAIGHLAPALVQRHARTASEIELTLKDVGRRCSTLLTRTWSVRSY